MKKREGEREEKNTAKHLSRAHSRKLQWYEDIPMNPSTAKLIKSVDILQHTDLSLTCASV